MNKANNIDYLTNKCSMLEDRNEMLYKELEQAEKTNRKQRKYMFVLATFLIIESLILIFI